MDVILPNVKMERAVAGILMTPSAIRATELDIPIIVSRVWVIAEHGARTKLALEKERVF